MKRTVGWLCYTLFAASVAGCAHPEVRGGGQYVAIAPTVGPGWASSYDFDLLADVTAEGCANLQGNTAYHVSAPGFEGGDDLAHQSLAAAAFEAISKMQGADLVLVTRSVTRGDPTSQVCSTIWGKAVRIRKAGGLLQAVPTSAAPSTGGFPLPPPH